MKQAENEIVKEGGNVEVYCNASGIPDPTVTWKNVNTGDLEGNWLNITNITRAQAGEYRCIANNTCGEASTVVDINVQCKNITYNQGLLTLIGWTNVGGTIILTSPVICSCRKQIVI